MYSAPIIKETDVLRCSISYNINTEPAQIIVTNAHVSYYEVREDADKRRYLNLRND